LERGQATELAMGRATGRRRHKQMVARLRLEGWVPRRLYMHNLLMAVHKGVVGPAAASGALLTWVFLAMKGTVAVQQPPLGRHQHRRWRLKGAQDVASTGAPATKKDRTGATPQAWPRARGSDQVASLPPGPVLDPLGQPCR
jgi:hypothetical protein